MNFESIAQKDWLTVWSLGINREKMTNNVWRDSKN